MYKKIIGILIILLFLGANSIPGMCRNIVKIQSSIIDSKSSSKFNWWPMFHNDAMRNGYSNSTAPYKNDTLWLTYVGDHVFSSPAVVNGRLYVGTWNDDGFLYCINAADGNIIWNYSTNGMIISSPMVANGRVYFGSADKVYCLDAYNGSEIWIFNESQSIYLVGSPALANGLLYISSAGGVFCLNPENGNQYWNFSTMSQIFGSCAVGFGNVYFGTVGDKKQFQIIRNDFDPISYFNLSMNNNVTPQIYCLNALTGDVIWNISNISIWGTPALSNNNLYIGGILFNKNKNGSINSESNLYCFDAYTGEYIWKNSSFLWYSAPAVFENRIVVSNYGGEIKCFNTFNGELLWNYLTNCTIYCSPSIADNKVYVAIGAGLFGCLNLSDGELLWKIDTFRVNFFDSSPAIADKRVFTGTFKGYVYAFGEPNIQPDIPDITGLTNGKTGIEYEYTFTSNDPDGYELWYFIDWDDGDSTGWIGPFSSNEEIKLKHTWSTEGTYLIKAKVKDVYENESDWGELEVNIPRTRATNMVWYEWFLERFPLLDRLLNLIIIR